MERVTAELHDIKKSLEKCLPEINHEEQIFDLLGALDRIQLTPKLIKEMKLGNLMSTIRNKFKESEPKISEKAAALMASWKKLIEMSMAEHRQAETGEHEKKEIHHSLKVPTANFVQPAPPTSSSQKGTKLDQHSLNASVNALPPSRKIVFNIFLNTLKPSSTLENATAVALRIEEELFAQFPSESMIKGYTNKAKTLAFNLKKNDALRNNIACGVITPHSLLSLSAADLASHEQKVERERLQAELVDSHRSDWLEAHKAELQVDIGIDPNNKWDFDNGEDGNNSEPDVEGD